MLKTMYFYWKCTQELHGSNYRTRAIITRGLYLFYPIFHCGLYFRAGYIAERFELHRNFFEPQNRDSFKIHLKKKKVE